MPKVITIGTLKGGTGKTSTIYNLSSLLAETNKVLLIDCDPQCNLSLNVGVDVVSTGLKSIKNIFESKVKAKDVIFKSPMECLPNLDIIPSSIGLTITELEIVSQAGREQIIKHFIEDNKEELSSYDYILIDTNPSMSIINQNCFLVADSILLISDISLNAIQGAELFIALWEKTRNQLRIDNNVKGLIINNYDKRIKLSSELIDYCKDNENVSNLLLKTIIPNSVKIKESELEHKPINILHKNSNINKAFSEIIGELKERGVV